VWPHGQPRRGDQPTALLAPAIPACRDPLQGRLDLSQDLPLPGDLACDPASPARECSTAAGQTAGHELGGVVISD